MPIQAPASEAPEPPSDDLLTRAAHGDPDAQSALADAATQQMIEGLISPEEAVIVSELWMRMAATHGSPKKIMALSGLLLTRAALAEDAGNMRAALFHQAEAIHLLNICADEGEEFAAEVLGSASAYFMPEAVKMAADNVSAMQAQVSQGEQ